MKNIRIANDIYGYQQQFWHFIQPAFYISIIWNLNISFQKRILGLNIYKMMMKVKQGYLNCWLSQLITHILVLQEVEAKIESFRQHLKLKLADLPSPPEEQKRLIRYYWHKIKLTEFKESSKLVENMSFPQSD